MAPDTIPSAPGGTSRSDRGADLLFEANAVHLPTNALISGIPPGSCRLFFEQSTFGMLQLRENAGSLPRL